jgi:hypothetical protein
LNTTAENVLNRSNKPNTDLGMMPVPSAPISMAVKHAIAHALSEGIGSLRAPIAISTSEMMEKSTTKL